MLQKYIQVLTLISILVASGCTTGKTISFNGAEDLAAVKKYAKKYDIKPPYASSYPKLYFKGDEVRNGMIDLINRAEKYIVINTYLIINDEYGNIILEALRKKYEEGVNIYVMADSSSHFMGEESGFI